MSDNDIQRLEERIEELEKLLDQAKADQMSAEALLGEDGARTLKILKQQEQEADLLQRRIDLAFQATGDGLWEIKMPGDEVWFSERSMAMLGYDADEIIPSWDGLLKLIHEDDRKQADRIFGDFMEGDRSAFPARLKFRHKSGAVHSMLVRAVHQTDEKDRVVAVVGSITDITELEEERDKVQELAKFPENNPNPIFQFKMDGEMTYVNPAATAIMDRLTPDDIFNDRLVKLIESGEELIKYEITSGYNVFLMTAYARSQMAEPLINVYLLDITERKQYETALETAKQEAEAASIAKSDFLATMSHELRTPMNGIIGLSDLMQDLDLSGEPKELARTIYGSAQNLLGLINDILDFSKIEADELNLEPHSIAIKAFIGDSVGYLRHLAQEKGLDFTVDLSENLPCYVYVDSLRIRQVINNLVGNAIKFTEAGEVKIMMRPSTHMPDAIDVIISDTGIGIPKDKIDLIFNKFQTLEGRDFGGTGLGLAISQRLVELMGGVISVVSEHGQGTEFSFTIPVYSDKATAEAPKESETGQEEKTHTNQPLLGKRVLSVDDHPTNLMMVKRLLLKMGAAEVVEATEGQEAVDAWQNQGPFDVIIMDFHMPGMDGLKATKVIRALENDLNVQHTPIIIVTADAMKETFEKCLAAGVDDYVTKPISRPLLIQTISKYVVLPDVDFVFDDHALTQGDDAVDVVHLREFSDGEIEIEQEFFEVYDTQAKQCLLDMDAHLEAQNNEEWRKAAHKLKGASANLGAFPLSDLCKAGEDGFEKDEPFKRDLLNQITQELQRVRVFMQELHNS